MTATATPRPTASPAVLRRNLSFDVVGSVGLGVTTALVGSLLPTMARQTGIPPLGLALLATTPFAANLLGAWAGRIGPRSPRRLAVLRATGASLLVGLALAPTPALIILGGGLFWLSISMAIPFQFRLWAGMYPGSLRGRLMGFIGMARSAAAGLAAIGLGLLADAAGAPAALAIGGGLGVGCAIALAGLRADVPPTDGAYSARQAIGVLRREPILRRLVLSQGLYGGGLIAASPLYALVHVDRLGLSLGDVGSIAVVASVAAMFSLVSWGALLDRRGPRIVLGAGSAAGLASVLVYATAPGLAALWLAALLGGIAAAGIEIGIQGTITARTAPNDRAAAMAGLNAVTGARGLVVPFISTTLVQAGVVDVTTAILLCALPTAAGVVLYAGLPVGRAAGVARQRGAAVSGGLVARAGHARAAWARAVGGWRRRTSKIGS